MKNPLVSVIVPVYQVEKYLRNCITSVIHQTYSYWELILVDDGSFDHSPAICDEYAGNDSRIRVIHKQNGGLSSARNAALDVFEGDYVTFLDSDDFWHPDYLKIMIELCENSNADIAQCDFVRGEATSFPRSHKKTHIQILNNHHVFTLQAASIIMCAKLYRRHLWNDIRMPVGVINEDDWTTWKLYYSASCIVVTNQQLYYYTYNVNSIMLKKKEPDLRYFGAYEERINFFLQTGDLDMVAWSRLQFCKSLVMIYSNSLLTTEQRQHIICLFSNNWRYLRFSLCVPFKFKLLFFSFAIAPLWISIYVREQKG